MKALSIAFAVLLLLPGALPEASLLQVGSSPESSPTAGAISVVLDPAKTRIDWTLPATMHTVHGTFSLERGRVFLDQATHKASGEIVVDAKSGQSGNSSRDSRMHREIIESDKYGEISFQPSSFVGDLPSDGAADLQLKGIFTLHGTDHEIMLPIHASFSGNHWDAKCTFNVPYVSWGLKNPSSFLLKVKPEVQVEFNSSGEYHFESSELHRIPYKVARGPAARLVHGPQTLQPTR